jgi:hypothetical protein
LAAAALAVMLLVAGCSGAGARQPDAGGAKQAGPLSDKDVDDLSLKSAVGLVIREVLTEGNPQALRQFFPPDVRSSADCAAFYRQLVGAPPGTYQPRFWDTKLLEVRYLDGRRTAHTSLTVECTELRPGAGGGGKFLSLELDWVKQGHDWFLAPVSRPAAPTNEAGGPASAAGPP